MANKLDDYANQDSVRRAAGRLSTTLTSRKWSPPAGAPLCKPRKTGTSKKGSY